MGARGQAALVARYARKVASERFVELLRSL
jgi:hypothetical protein